MYLVSGPSPWKRPLPVYISNPAPREGSNTGSFCFNTEQPFTFFLTQFTYLLAHHSLTTDRISHVNGCPATHPHTHTHTHILNTDQYVHSSLNPHALSPCLAESPTHPCKRYPPLLLDSFDLFLFHHSPFVMFYLFLVPLSISAVTFSFARLQFSGH